MELEERVRALEVELGRLRPELRFPTAASLEHRLRWLGLVLEELKDGNKGRVRALDADGLRKLLKGTVHVKTDRITLQPMTADPVAVVEGDIWFRVDLGKLKFAISTVVAEAKATVSKEEVVDALFCEVSWPSDSWASMGHPLLANAALPGITESHGSLVLWKGRYLFILQGSWDYGFWCYDLARGGLVTLAAPPAAIADGSLVGVHAGRYLYTCEGYETANFYRYDIITNSWATMAPTPVTIGTDGGGAVYDGQRYIYLTRGGATPDFYRYDCETDTWAIMASLPYDGYLPGHLVKADGYLYTLAGSVAGVLTRYWLRYDIATDTWATMAATPEPARGGALAWDGGDYIYVAWAAGAVFWRYSIPADAWAILAPPPADFGRGGLAYYKNLAIGDVIIARRGRDTTDWWLYKV